VIVSNNVPDYFKLAGECKTDHQKIKFFDDYQVAFFTELSPLSFSLEENVPNNLDDAFYVYANMNRMSEEEFFEFKKVKWKNYPCKFKIFLFDFLFFHISEY
tara:strand:+ start:1184 stop:1489 length:306 start_codon:yes stop_codon:yes gene_type:complete